MSQSCDRYADLYLADALKAKVEKTPEAELLAEVAEDFGDGGKLAREFDTAFAHAKAQTGGWQITSSFKNLVSHLAMLSQPRSAMAAVVVLAAAAGGFYVFVRSTEPERLASLQDNEPAKRSLRKAPQSQSVKGPAPELDALKERIWEIRRAGDQERTLQLASQYLAAAKEQGEEPPKYARRLYDIAILYQDMNRLPEAEQLYRDALTIQEKVLGPDHPEVAVSLNNLASTYYLEGHYQAAEPLFLRSLHIQEKVFGADHPSADSSLSNLALLYQAQGRYAEAEPLFQRSLANHEKALGPEHPTVGSSLKNLALLYQAQGRYAEARPLLARCLAITEKQFGYSHFEADSLRRNLAELTEKEKGSTASKVPEASVGKKMQVLHLAMLAGHAGPILSCEFSADGKRLVTVSGKTLRVWDIASGQAVYKANDSDAELIAAALAPDGKRIVTVSSDKTVKERDTISGNQVVLYRSGKGDPLDVAFGRTGWQFLEASEGNTATVYGEAQGSLLLRGHNAPVSSAMFSRDGRFVLTFSDDRSIRLWDAQSAHPLTVLDGYRVTYAALSPDARRLAAVGSENWSVRLVDIATGRETRVFKGHTAAVVRAEFDPSGKLLITASDDATARLWDVESGAAIAVLKGNGVSVKSAAFSPDSHLVATGSQDGSVRLWRLFATNLEAR